MSKIDKEANINSWIFLASDFLLYNINESFLLYDNFHNMFFENAVNDCFNLVSNNYLHKLPICK